MLSLVSELYMPSIHMPGFSLKVYSKTIGSRPGTRNEVLERVRPTWSDKVRRQKLPGRLRENDESIFVPCQHVRTWICPAGSCILGDLMHVRIV